MFGVPTVMGESLTKSLVSGVEDRTWVTRSLSAAGYSELQAGMHIGARDIELDDLHRVHGVHRGGDLDIIVDGVSCD